ncbi:MAG: hypothetical protein C0482_05190 [Gordonia sp.]|nr:hypothetical protein [Gordonia sp. (in: high G+C Gram-positive bacteria)]
MPTATKAVRTAARRRPLHVLVVGLVLAMGPTGCADVLGLDTDDPTDAAKVLGISIPDGAEKVQSYTHSSAQGNCTDLSFLMPTDKWQPYVSDYFSTDLVEEFANYLACNNPRERCPETSATQKLGASDRVEVDDSTQDRTILVISECEPGWTLIAWKSSKV